MSNLDHIKNIISMAGTVLLLHLNMQRDWREAIVEVIT